MFPTPRASEGPKGSPNQHGSSGDLMLTSAVIQRVPAAQVPLLPTPRVSADRTSRQQMVDAKQWSAPSLAQAVELAQGILPREFKSWDEVPGWSQSFRPDPPEVPQGPVTVATGDAGGQPTLFGTADPDGVQRSVEGLLPTPVVSDRNGAGGIREGAPNLNTVAVAALLPTPTVAAATGGQTARGGDRSDERLLAGIAEDVANGKLIPTPTAQAARHGGVSPSARQRWDDGCDVERHNLWTFAAATEAWGEYAPAITRWAMTIGMPPPPPTEPGRTGNPRLSPSFVSWLMGLLPFWVTGVSGLSRNEQLKLLGNGVVPQQALAAYRDLIGEIAYALAA